MYKGVVMFFIMFCLILGATPAVSAPDMQDGSWEIVTSMEMPGMPAGMMKPVKHTACLTQKDAVPQKQESGCKIISSKISGNTVTWTVTCDKDGVVSEGKITYAGTKFNGVMMTTVNQKGQKMQMKSTMNGKRLGPCK